MFSIWVLRSVAEHTNSWYNSGDKSDSPPKRDGRGRAGWAAQTERDNGGAEGAHRKRREKDGTNREPAGALDEAGDAVPQVAAVLGGDRTAGGGRGGCLPPGDRLGGGAAGAGALDPVAAPSWGNGHRAAVPGVPDGEGPGDQSGAGRGAGGGAAEAAHRAADLPVHHFDPPGGRLRRAGGGGPSAGRLHGGLGGAGDPPGRQGQPGDGDVRDVRRFLRPVRHPADGGVLLHGGGERGRDVLRGAGALCGGLPDRPSGGPGIRPAPEPGL